MGLAAAGQPVFEDFFRDLIRVSVGGRIAIEQKWMRLNGQEFNRRCEASLGTRFGSGEAEHSERAANVAASCQRVVSDAMCKILAQSVSDATNVGRVVVGGGVALNCSALGRCCSQRSQICPRFT